MTIKMPKKDESKQYFDIAKERRVRFSIDIDQSLHKKLRLKSVECDCKMTDIVRDILSQYLT